MIRNPYLTYLADVARQVARAAEMPEVAQRIERWAATSAEGPEAMNVFVAETQHLLRGVVSSLPAAGGFYCPSGSETRLGDLPSWDSGGVYWIPAILVADDAADIVAPEVSTALNHFGGRAIEWSWDYDHSHTRGQSLGEIARSVIHIVAYRAGMRTTAEVAQLEAALGRWDRSAFERAVFVAVASLVEALPRPDLDPELRRFAAGNASAARRRLAEKRLVADGQPTQAAGVV